MPDTQHKRESISEEIKVPHLRCSGYFLVYKGSTTKIFDRLSLPLKMPFQKSSLSHSSFWCNETPTASLAATRSDCLQTWAPCNIWQRRHVEFALTVLLTYCFHLNYRDFSHRFLGFSALSDTYFDLYFFLSGTYYNSLIQSGTDCWHWHYFLNCSRICKEN